MTAGVSRPGAETGGTFEPDAPLLPSPSAVERRTPVPGSADTPEPAGRLSGPSSWAAVQALAALLEPEAFDPDVPAAPEWRERAQNSAVGYAARAIDAGYRRVVVDDTTVERVAAEIADADGQLWEEIMSACRHGSKWAPKAVEYYQSLGRAAVRAVLGETS